ncbi:MAG: Eco57I restriction-modification methylase domain-containing protein [Cytophagales bacterium]|nr:Eco57I restriction-modification methylase domain-containing protein [Cytophagales bacterium]
MEISDRIAKNLGQVFTPPAIVNLMLDSIGYSGPDILCKRVLEPSFGDGAFLEEIVKRYILSAQKEGWNEERTKRGIENCVCGVEIDDRLFQTTIASLDRLAISFGIGGISWKLENKDFLLSERKKEYQIVVGNPPYIRLHHLRKETRDRLRARFKFCKRGTTDIYIAFFELGLSMLSKDGVLAYITPNTFMKNTSNQTFRDYISANNLMSMFIDFGSYRIFENVNTYNCISILQRDRTSNSFSYHRSLSGKPKCTNVLRCQDYIGRKFIFGDKEELRLLSKVQSRKPLGLIANVQYGLCTQRDDVYISHSVEDTDRDYCLFNGQKMERAILRPIVKGSRMKDGKKRRIIFPYRKVGNRWTAIPESKMRRDYPYLYNYLLSHKDSLLKRDADKGVLWYEFGRSQSIQTIHKKKLIIDQIVNGKVNVCQVDSDTMAYSGIILTLKWDKTPLHDIKEMLGTDEFLKYARFLGKDMQNDYKTITTSIIRQYGIRG